MTKCKNKERLADHYKMLGFGERASCMLWLDTLEQEAPSAAQFAFVLLALAERVDNLERKVMFHAGDPRPY